MNEILQRIRVLAAEIQSLAGGIDGENEGSNRDVSQLEAPRPPERRVLKFGGGMFRVVKTERFPPGEAIPILAVHYDGARPVVGVAISDRLPEVEPHDKGAPSSGAEEGLEVPSAREDDYSDIIRLLP